MDTTGDLFTRKVAAGSRTYFFDVKESSEGAKYLKISESRNKGDSFERHRIMIFEEDIFAFNVALQEAIRFMFEKQRSHTSGK